MALIRKLQKIQSVVFYFFTNLPLGIFFSKIRYGLHFAMIYAISCILNNF
jgi:hypothetical protein